MDGKAEIESYKPLNVQLKTDSPEAKFLVLTDNYYNGWKAQVDGRDSEILKANFIDGKHLPFSKEINDCLEMPSCLANSS